jgi:hypothetical protein
MDGSIIAVPRSMIEAKARAAHARGVGRDEHNFNWHSYAAIAVWQTEWDRCHAERSRVSGNHTAVQSPAQQQEVV